MAGPEICASIPARRLRPPALSLPMLVSNTARGHSEPAWRDGFTSRLEALALLQTLNADLLSHDSADLSLDRWCDAHHLANPAKIVAERVHDAEQAPTAEQRKISASARRSPSVSAKCASPAAITSCRKRRIEYVPGRLTPDMNRVLDTHRHSFQAARCKRSIFRRHTLAATLLWSPLPQNWDMGAPLPETHAGTLTIPHGVLEHRAVLTLPDGTPFSRVVETYTSEVLAVPATGSAWRAGVNGSSASHERCPARRRARFDGTLTQLFHFYTSALGWMTMSTEEQHHENARSVRPCGRTDARRHLQCGRAETPETPEIGDAGGGARPPGKKRANAFDGRPARRG